ncbi:uncharacterized protein LOC102314601 isoform X1 [Haplochromis burtoni]|uniref:uncharacterized protein LOC102314601 isoform X1 n=1 Tax=Haplochromis burtoni TaxID=8153 RepID=UPI001C2DEA50|nr:uncharacterized protein LOC102314601 isoform X1 [Haplochromis burtoni]
MRPGRAQNKDNCKQTSSGNFLHQFILLYNDKPAATTALLIGCLSRAAGVMKCSEPPELIIRNFVFNVRQEMSKAEEEQVCINIHSVMCHGLKTVEGNEGNVRLRQQDGRFAPLQQCVWISEQRENIHTEYAQPLRRHMIQSAGPRCSPGSRGDDDSRGSTAESRTHQARTRLSGQAETAHALGYRGNSSRTAGSRGNQRIMGQHHPQRFFLLLHLQTKQPQSQVDETSAPHPAGRSCERPLLITGRRSPGDKLLP